MKRHSLPAILLALALLAAPAQAAVVVNAQGTDSGDTPSDFLGITGDDTTNSLVIREGFEGDVGPGGEPDSCGGSDLLCFLTVQSLLGPIQAQGACQPIGSDTVRCAYFHSGTAQSSHTWRARIDLRGAGNDRVRITQDAVTAAQVALTTPWDWEIDYGAGNDIIEGSEVLFTPDSVGTVSLLIGGGPGSDLFKGEFPDRPTTLRGDDIGGAVNVSGTDIFENVQRGAQGLRIEGQAGDDSILPLSSRIVVDGGAGNDVLNMRGAALDTSVQPPVVLDGGTGTDVIAYPAVQTPLTLRLDGSLTSTGNNTLRGFENATGGAGADRIIGTNVANVLKGGGGAGDTLSGGGGNDTLDVDDGALQPRSSGDDTADGGAGEDLILANDGVRDVVLCGSSSHTQTVFINNRPTQLSIFDSDRARLDLTDFARDCEDVQREAVRTPPAARIAGVKLVGGRARLSLRCPGGARRGCHGRARVEATGGARRAARGGGVAYRLRRGGRGAALVPLPRGARRKLHRRGFAVVRAVVVERDARGRDRTRQRTALLKGTAR
jgi:Ca2+-binding RTX toxin-like protein